MLKVLEKLDEMENKLVNLENEMKSLKAQLSTNQVIPTTSLQTQK